MPAPAASVRPVHPDTDSVGSADTSSTPAPRFSPSLRGSPTSRFARIERLYKSLGRSANDLPPDPLREVRRGLLLTGLGTWLALTVHSLLAVPSREGLAPAEEGLWLAVMAAFALTLFVAVKFVERRSTRLWLAALQLVLALVGNALLDGNSVLAGLTLLVAAQVGLCLPVGLSVLWVLAQTAGLLSVFLPYWSVTDAWAYASGYLCFQLFAVTTTRVALREAEARGRLSVLLEELRITRALLSEASRQAERLDIARDLHDVAGHHLSALSMNLQVALHLTPDGPARAPVERADHVARCLLADVRQTVQGLRGAPDVEFTRDLKALIGAVPVPVHLNLPPDLRITCGVRAQVLLRTAQEALTNVARHARASQVWLTVGQADGLLSMDIRDDGRGAAELRFGCGLSGMQERLESLGGTLHVHTERGAGLTLQARLPLRGPA